MNKQAGLIAAIIALIFTAWWAGYALIGKDNPKPRIATPVPVAADIRDRDDIAPEQDPVAVQEAARAPVPRPILFQGWEPDMSGSLAKVCLRFSTSINLDNTRFTDYIVTKPDVKLAASVGGTRACLSGFDFDTEYDLTIKAGLPATSGSELLEDRKVAISFGDKPAVLRFAGDGVILPRIGAQGLAVETINIDEITLDISSVGDRIIARRDPQSGQASADGEYNYTYANAATNVRETVWTGSFDVKTVSNKVVTTVVPLADIIGDLSPGAYVITAEKKRGENERRPAKAWRWVIVTDIAITSYQTDDALDVTLRSLDTAKTVSDARVTLVASNNRILGEAKTDVNGHASFDGALLKGAGAAAPRMVMAYGPNGDYAILDMRRSPLDLSDRDVNGRSAGEVIDPYIYTDRGVYRPGERVNIIAMLRDNRAKAQPREGTFKLIRPNGVVALEKRFTESELLGSALAHSFGLPESAPRGLWTLELHADGLDLIGSHSISVEDFVPQKIKVDIKTDEGVITNDNDVTITLASEFLYGGPGKDLEAEAEMRVRVDPKPFPKYDDFTFGLASETFREQNIVLVQGLTNAKGELETEASLSGYNIKSSYPLRGEITAGIAEPGGRYIKNSARVPVRTNDVYLGIRPGFTGNRAQRSKPFDLDIVALDAMGAPQSKTLEWKLVYEDWDYVWYRNRSRWRYRFTINDSLRDSGEITTGSDGLSKVTQNLNWGRYRLIVTDAETNVSASYKFSVGWGGASRSDRPDQLVMAGPTEPTQPGRYAELTLKAPYAGQGELVIASDKIHEIRPITIPEGGSTIRVRVDKDWGASVYGLITLYTPRDKTERPVPRRAVGLVHIPIRAVEQTLNVSIDAPEVTRPRQIQNVTVNIDGMKDGQNYLTLAAVDEGILRITKFDSPDAAAHYFGKKAFGLELRDDYARLLNPNLGEATLARSGGDSLGGEGLTVAPTKIVSLFSGVINVRNGKAVIPLQLPEFNGEIRLMATAWNDTAVGSASRAMKVRDPVPATLSLPRFLAPGDTAIATVSLDNVEGEAGSYGYALSGGDLTADADSKGQVQLAKQQRERGLITLTSNDSGIRDLEMNITGPQNYTVQSSYQIQSRSPFMPVERRIETRMTAGQTLALPEDLALGLNPDSVEINVSFAPSPDLDPASYAASLSKYPYGCTEQTISSGLPLLYADDLGGMPRQDAAELNRRMQNAVYKISNRMDDQGSFGLWRAGDYAGHSWLGAYATEFLQRAEAEGYDVSEDVMKRSYGALQEMTRMENYSSLAYLDYRYRRNRNQSRYKGTQAETAAYAHYVLARGGQGDLSKMRYFYDTHRKNLRSPMSFAQIGTAFAMMGDKVRANSAFDAAFEAIGYEEENNYYQSPLRDSAALVALAAEAEMPSRISEAQTIFASSLKDPKRLSTQEKARTIMAMRAIKLGGAELKVSAKGVDGFDPQNTVGLDSDYLAQNVSFSNTGERDVYRVISIYGTPTRAPAAFAEGYDAEKKVLSITGESISLAAMQKGDQAVILISMRSTISRSRQTVIADLLPAGFEIETILRPEDGKREDNNAGPYAWVGEIAELEIAEARDDRFVASLKTQNQSRHRIAYVVRAVTAGDFTIPGVVIEDMYRPGEVAITPAGRVTILSTQPG